jgi:hypothetical protein
VSHAGDARTRLLGFGTREHLRFLELISSNAQQRTQTFVLTRRDPPARYGFNHQCLILTICGVSFEIAQSISKITLEKANKVHAIRDGKCDGPGRTITRTVSAILTHRAGLRRLAIIYAVGVSGIDLISQS